MPSLKASFHHLLPRLNPRPVIAQQDLANGSRTCRHASIASAAPSHALISSTPPRHHRQTLSQPTSAQTATMSTMPASHGHNEACCNIPPVVATGYKPKGTYEEVGGLKSYVTGPADATKAIVVIYDIFGYFDQTVQGADILAYSDDHQKYKVYMPDWFNGKPCPIEM